MISTTAEYALRVMVSLARGPSTPRTTQEIAEGTRVPAAYLSKVIQGLVEAGLVNSRRGRRGGVALARRPNEISLLHVVRAVDPPLRIEECPLGPDFHDQNLCPLHRRLNDAAKRAEDVLERTRLSEVLTESPGTQPLCQPKRSKTAARKSARKRRR